MPAVLTDPLLLHVRTSAANHKQTILQYLSRQRRAREVTVAYHV
jgi:hypothetical protein